MKIKLATFHDGKVYYTLFTDGTYETEMFPQTSWCVSYVRTQIGYFRKLMETQQLHWSSGSTGCVSIVSDLKATEHGISFIDDIALELEVHSGVIYLGGAQ